MPAADQVLLSLRELQALKARPRAEVHAEVQLHNRLQKVFDDVAKQTLRELLGRERIPPDPRSILRAFQEAVPEMANIAVEDALEAAQHGRNRIIDQLRKSGVSISFDDIPQTIANRMREAVFEASASTMQRLVGNVQETLAGALEDGLGVREAADRLGDAFQGMSDFELRRVARTEIQAFQNAGAFETARQYNIRYHQWVTAGDALVRDSHEDVEGEIVELGTPFSNGLRYPLDTSGPPEEFINCRCRAVPFLVPVGYAAPHEGPFFEDDLLVVEGA